MTGVPRIYRSFVPDVVDAVGGSVSVPHHGDEVIEVAAVVLVIEVGKVTYNFGLAPAVAFSLGRVLRGVAAEATTSLLDEPTEHNPEDR